MRNCIRCGSPLREGYALRSADVHVHAMMIASSDSIFCSVVARPKAAICPNCGEVSFYIEDPAVLDKKTMW